MQKQIVDVDCGLGAPWVCVRRF